MSIIELEIIKAALEGDIRRQKESENASHPAWKNWLEESEKLLKKVSRKLFEMKAKQQFLNDIKK